MNFFSRKLGTTDIAADMARDQDAQRIVHREIEVTVERTWITVSARVPCGEPPPPPIRREEGSQ